MPPPEAGGPGGDEPAPEPEDPDDTTRISGQDRILTAIRASEHVWNEAQTVLLARADVYADAIAGASLAGLVRGPILLTPGDTLPPEVADEITRLQATDAIVLGGAGAVGPEVVNALEDLSLDVDRVAGASRFDTARLLALRVAETNPPTEAFLVEGIHADPNRGWPDAVSSASWAAATATPVLLTAQDRLPDASASALRELGVERVVVVGGTGSVGGDVADAVLDLGLEVDRVSGPDRYATSQAVAEQAIGSDADVDLAPLWVATGRGWPDALSAGPAAAAQGGVLVLVDGTNPDQRLDWFTSGVGRDASDLTVVGGPGAVSSSVVARLFAVLD